MPPITYEWYDDDHTAIIWYFHPRWTWNEALAAQLEINQMVESVPDKIIHYILDVSNSSTMPFGSLNKIPELIRNRHPQRGAVIVVGANFIITRLWHVFSSMLGNTTEQGIIFVQALDEADALLMSLTITDES